MKLTGAPRYTVHVPTGDGQTQRAIYVLGETVAKAHRAHVPDADLSLFKTRRKAKTTPKTTPTDDA